MTIILSPWIHGLRNFLKLMRTSLKAVSVTAVCVIARDSPINLEPPHQRQGLTDNIRSEAIHECGITVQMACLNWSLPLRNINVLDELVKFHISWSISSHDNLFQGWRTQRHNLDFLTQLVQRSCYRYYQPRKHVKILLQNWKKEQRHSHCKLKTTTDDVFISPYLPIKWTAILPLCVQLCLLLLLNILEE